jgi:hypothetical protein
LIFFFRTDRCVSLAFYSQPIEREADSRELKAALDFFVFAGFFSLVGRKLAQFDLKSDCREPKALKAGICSAKSIRREANNEL